MRTTSNQQSDDLTESKTGESLVSEESIFPTDLKNPSKNPFNLQALPLPNEQNSNGATMYVGTFQMLAMPMTLPGFPLPTTGNIPNVFGNKN